ncbi:DoxX family membrane protein [Lipingzhangella sp. LS1_29]|uniref:DoxX family membrane protein n=1 Tax=Lipingzhangella rawalii TaxID=2055835 RepID=A0ABU2HBP9_9ACTN|nr:DoxX family membrane protein [Lipingzhangella rawalii]MDS1272417.1 DoxX family membrane protein [Lipingzhangella rawalii]
MGLRAGDLAVLGVRAALGGTLFAHGAQKLFGWFGGGGPEGTAQAFDQMGHRPGHVTARAAGVAEAAGGAGLALGLATPASAAAVAGTMGVAAELHSPNGFFNANGGLEYPALIGLTAMSIIVSGPGKVSLDHATCHVLDRPWMRAVAFAAVVPAVGVVVARRRAALAAAERDSESGGSGTAEQN